MRRTVTAGRELDIPIRQHCYQSEMEFDRITVAYDMTPLECLDSLGALDERMLLHGELVAGTRNIARLDHRAHLRCCRRLAVKVDQHVRASP